MQTRKHDQHLRKTCRGGSRPQSTQRLLRRTQRLPHPRSPGPATPLQPRCARCDLGRTPGVVLLLPSRVQDAQTRTRANARRHADAQPFAQAALAHPARAPAALARTPRAPAARWPRAPCTARPGLQMNGRERQLQGRPTVVRLLHVVARLPGQPRDRRPPRLPPLGRALPVAAGHGREPARRAPAGARAL